MIIESGTLIFLGLLFLFWKLKPETCLKMVGRPLALDLTTSLVAYALHYGTFSGMMAAAVAGMMTSAFTSIYSWLFGHIRGRVYTPGIVDWSYKLPEGYVCRHANVTRS